MMFETVIPHYFDSNVSRLFPDPDRIQMEAGNVLNIPSPYQYTGMGVRIKWGQREIIVVPVKKWSPVLGTKKGILIWDGDAYIFFEGMENIRGGVRAYLGK